MITYNKKSGLYILASHDIIVAANQFEENFDGVYCIDSPNLCMNGNNLDDHLGSAIVLEKTRISVLSGNMIKQSEGIGIILDKTCFGNTKSSNIFTNNKTGGIDLRHAHGCMVIGNTFINIPFNALRIGSLSARITVTGNNFTNDYIGQGKVFNDELSSSGIFLVGTSDISISGNVFSGVKPYAITSEGKRSERIVLSGNIFIDVEKWNDNFKKPKIK